MLLYKSTTIQEKGRIDLWGVNLRIVWGFNKDYLSATHQTKAAEGKYRVPWAMVARKILLLFVKAFRQRLSARTGKNIAMINNDLQLPLTAQLFLAVKPGIEIPLLLLAKAQF